MKTYWGVEVQLHALTSVLHGGEWSGSRPGTESEYSRYLKLHLFMATHKINNCFQCLQLQVRFICISNLQNQRNFVA